MGRFLSLAVFLTVALGLALHFNVEIPRVGDWIGTLPGDLVVKKGNIILYFPLATSALISLAVTFFLSLLFGKEK